MKIGIYAFWNVHQDASGVWAMGCHARYLRHFLELTEGVRLFTPVLRERRESETERIDDPRLEIVPLPDGSYLSAWLGQRRLRRIFAQRLAGLDAVYVRLFDPCPWLWAPLCEARGVGLVHDMVGDPVAGILQRRDWSLAGRWIRRGLFLPEEWLTFRAARKHALLLNGSELASCYGRRHPAAETIFSSTLEEEDFFRREDTCQGPTTRVLYVGVLRPAKRLESLIDAVAALRGEGRAVSLKIVGAGDPPSYVASLRQRAADRNIVGHVEFAGYVPLGPRLNAEYRSADVYAFPSLTEGAARTLLEAAAQSLPCVLTDVGGVRDLFAHGQSALLVPPDNAPAMADGIARMIDDDRLRRRCLFNARAMARSHTCRRFIQSMVLRLEREACSARGLKCGVGPAARWATTESSLKRAA